MPKEQIIIETVHTVAGLGVIKRVREQIDGLGFGLHKATKEIDAVNKKGEFLGKTITKTTKGLHKFQFEWLGVMFAGMALYRVFGGLIRRQLELFGVMAMFSGMMTVIFIPLMEILAPILFTIMEYFMDLPEGVKLAIGVFVLLAAGLGLILFIIGQMALAFNSFIILALKMFPTLGSAIVKAGGSLKFLISLVSGLSATVLAVVAVVILVFIGMYLAWKSNFLGMQKVVSRFVDGFKTYFNGIIKVVKGILKVVKGVFTGDWEDIIDGLKLIWEGYVDVLKGAWAMLWNGLEAIAIGAIRIIMGPLKLLVDAMDWVADKVSGVFGFGNSKMFDTDKFFPSFQKGGVIPANGLYNLHAGETVVPTNTSFAPNITINANIASDIDIRHLADRISEIWVSQFDRLTKTRSL